MANILILPVLFYIFSFSSSFLLFFFSLFIVFVLSHPFYSLHLLILAPLHISSLTSLLLGTPKPSSSLLCFCCFVFVFCILIFISLLDSSQVGWAILQLDFLSLKAFESFLGCVLDHCLAEMSTLAYADVGLKQLILSGKLY